MDVFRTSFEYGELGGTSAFRVLVADDHAPSRRLYDAILGSCGCVVTMVSDGAEALAVASSQDFDLICLDRHMPHLTGDGVADQLRALHGDGPRPYLVLCTSDLRPGDAPGRFDAALSKPIRPQDMVDAVVEALRFKIGWREGRQALEPATPVFAA
jgi:CheY-like chemotaxis protein